MKRSLARAALALLAATVAFTLPASASSAKDQEVDPDTLRILWSNNAHTTPAFIPQALLSDLDLTSAETLDLSHLPMTGSQKTGFKSLFFDEPLDSTDCFQLPIIDFLRHKEDLKLSTLELLAKQRIVTTGVVRKIVPGWLTGIDMPGKMIFVEVVEVLRDKAQVAVPGEQLVFTQISGSELVIGGKRLCSVKTGDFEAAVGDKVLLLGSWHLSGADYVGGEVFRIQDSLIYPNPNYGYGHQKNSGPIPFWKLREEIETLAELER